MFICNIVISYEIPNKEYGYGKTIDFFINGNFIVNSKSTFTFPTRVNNDLDDYLHEYIIIDRIKDNSYVICDGCETKFTILRDLHVTIINFFDDNKYDNVINDHDKKDETIIRFRDKRGVMLKTIKNVIANFTVVSFKPKHSYDDLFKYVQKNYYKDNMLSRIYIDIDNSEIFFSKIDDRLYKVRYDDPCFEDYYGIPLNYT
jgi:hypothetical protein